MTGDRPERQLPKAYLRMDPDIDQKHPDNLAELIRLMCASARQRPRGRFANRAVLCSLFGRATINRFLARGDVVEEQDGEIVVDGWDAWQEGDMTVAERVRRTRNKETTPGAVRTANWRLRNRIFTRDGYTCRYCGKSDYNRDWLVLEHVIPDGPSTDENLVTACRPCNKIKGGRTPEEAGLVLLASSSDVSPLRHETHHVHVTPSTVLMSLSESPPRESVPSATPFMETIYAIERISGRPWSYRPGSWAWDTLEPDVRDFGAAKVIRYMEASGIEYPDGGELVKTAHLALHRLDKIKAPKDPAPPDNRLTAEELHRRRLEQVS